MSYVETGALPELAGGGGVGEAKAPPPLPPLANNNGAGEGPNLVD